MGSATLTLGPPGHSICCLSRGLGLIELLRIFASSSPHMPSTIGDSLQLCVKLRLKTR